MHTYTTKLPGVLIIEPNCFQDNRGSFKESFSAERYKKIVGIDTLFVQDNQSYSKGSVLRGLHFQKQHPQGKLISVTRGRIFDVVVDIDPTSPSFGQHVGLEISEENNRQLWVSPGYAHGFCVLSAEADVSYKCTDYYQADDEGGLAWDCPRLAIEWPIKNPILSSKDRAHPGLEQFLQP